MYHIIVPTGQSQQPCKADVKIVNSASYQSGKLINGNASYLGATLSSQNFQAWQFWSKNILYLQLGDVIEFTLHHTSGSAPHQVKVIADFSNQSCLAL